MISEPVEFPLFVSSIRLADRPGEMIPIDREQMTALPPIRTALRTRRKSERGHVPVHLHARLTEIGTLELWCSEIAGDRRWRLQFDVRSATQTDLEAGRTAGERQGVLDEAAWDAANANDRRHVRDPMQRIRPTACPSGSPRRSASSGAIGRPRCCGEFGKC